MPQAVPDFLIAPNCEVVFPAEDISHISTLSKIASMGVGLCAVDATPVEFCLATAGNGWLSNFSPHAFLFDGIYWRTAEHFYQAQKFATMARHLYFEIAGARTPEDAEYFGKHMRESDIPNDWKSHARLPAMIVAVSSKFLAHSDLRERLIATNDHPIIETSADDYFWGSGASGRGENNLGKILMTCRLLLRSNVAESALWEFRQSSAVALQLRLLGSPRCLSKVA